MDLLEYDSYKEAIKDRVRTLKKEKPHFSLSQLSKKIPIQYTYLSKALNAGKSHLNEDHLFRLCHLLEFFPEETEYIFLLRSRDTATDSARRDYLTRRIKHRQNAKERTAVHQEFESQRLSQEVAYLFDPTCIVVHVALMIKEFCDNPRKLCGALGLSVPQLKLVLQKLCDIGFIEGDPSLLSVKSVNENQIHYGTDHPLMRTHQSLLRQKMASQMMGLTEADKHCFMGTFTADEETFARIRTRFKTFLKEIEPLVSKAPSHSVYQVNFDLFRWL